LDHKGFRDLYNNILTVILIVSNIFVLREYGSPQLAALVEEYGVCCKIKQIKELIIRTAKKLWHQISTQDFKVLFANWILEGFVGLSLYFDI
jgi:hypothetical protein